MVGTFHWCEPPFWEVGHRADSAHCIEVGHHADSAHCIEVGHHADSAHCIEVGHHADSAHCIEVGHHADSAHCIEVGHHAGSAHFIPRSICHTRWQFDWMIDWLTGHSGDTWWPDTILGGATWWQADEPTLTCKGYERVTSRVEQYGTEI